MSYDAQTSPWTKRIQNANKYYEDWESKFKCEKLEQYYQGFQWKGKINANASGDNPYTLNLIYSTIKIKLATVLFKNPQFQITPRAGNSDWNQEFAIQSALIKQDTLNTIIGNKKLHFAKNLKRAALDSFFRFGLMEVGYAADWQNPGKLQPLMKSHLDPDVTDEKDRVIEDNELPLNERFYFKRIKPVRFRVSASDAEDIDACDWFGYYDYYYRSELENADGIKFPKDYSSQYISNEYSGYVSSGKDDEVFKKYLSLGAVCKVWHIWDNIAKKRLLILDDCNEEPMWSGDFERSPLIDIRWDENLNGFYPIPPVFQWLSSQNEINESREQMRSYRRRFTRKYQAVKDSIENDEITKFTSGPDGEVIWTKIPDAIRPILNPEVGIALDNAFVIAKDDFNIVSGTSSDIRGQADRTTATQAKITDARMSVRESSEQMDFAEFISCIGREALAQAAEKMSMGMWVKLNKDPGEDILTEVKMNPAYKYIQSQDLSDGYDFEIDVSIIDMSPQQLAAEKTKFIEFLTLIQNFPMLSLSPTLIRETAYRVGYRNEKVIHDMQKAAMLQMMGQAAQGAQNIGQNLGDVMQAPGAGNNIARAQIAQGQPNTADEIQSQITGQMQ